MIYLHMLIEEDIMMQKKRVVAVRRVRPYSFKGSAAVPPNCKNLCRELGSISHPTDNQKSIIIINEFLEIFDRLLEILGTLHEFLNLVSS